MGTSSVSFWSLLTRFGETQILMPLVALAALWLWLGADLGAQARRWLLAVGFALALTTASKLAFIGWELGVSGWDFTGVSGHAACSAAVLPMLAWVLACGRSPAARRCGVLGGFALAAFVAWSRLAVNVHSSSEVVSGFVLGSVSSWIALSGLGLVEDVRNSNTTASPRWLQAALLASLVLLPFGAPRSQSHDWVTAMSMRLSGRSQPFVRHDLHRHHQPAAASQSSRVSW